MLRKLKQYEQALEDGNRAIEVAPDFAEAIQEKSVILGEMGDKEGAEKELLLASSMLYERAKIFIGTNNFSEALESVKESLELNSKYIDPMLARAFIYSRTGKLPLAYQQLDQATIVDPSKNDIYLMYFNLLMGEKRNEEAIAKLTEGINNNPKVIEFYKLRAEQFANHNKLSEALSDCNHALAHEPTCSLTLLLKADMLQKLTKFAEALETI